MRRLTLALLSGAYLCVALIFALLLWRNGGGWAAGLAMLAAGFALCYTFHGLIMHSLENSALRRELENIREAQRMGQRLEERMVQAPPLSARHAPQHRQSAALLETIREALAENRVDLYL